MSSKIFGPFLHRQLVFGDEMLGACVLKYAGSGFLVRFENLTGHNDEGGKERAGGLSEARVRNLVCSSSIQNMCNISEMGAQNVATVQDNIFKKNCRLQFV